MRQILYETAELRVVAVRPYRGRAAVVTFSSYVHHRTLDRPGFGEAFLLKYGIDAVHVICRGTSGSSMTISPRRSPRRRARSAATKTVSPTD
jgi:hypothetical protein